MEHRPAFGAVNIALCVAIVSFYSTAQTSTSQINGVVMDSSGAVVPGATVTATNEATGVVTKQTTTSAGVFVFASMPLSGYTVEVQAAGFRPSKHTGVTLAVGSPAALNVTLEVGQAADAVTVESQAATVNTSDATLGDVVTQQSVEKLPLNGRNPLNLVVLQAGVVQTSGGGVNINGARAFATNVTIDGIDANESSNPSITNNIYRLSPDNVQEFKVTTSNPTAEEGRNSGANVSIATRSGTNQVHGTLYEFFRNTDLNASDFYANANGTAKQQVHMNQYGAEIGGPIVRNKLFYFGSYEGQYVNLALPITQSFGNVTLYTPTLLGGTYRYFVVNPSSPFFIGSTRITGNSPLLVNPKTGALAPGVRNCTSTTDSNCVASYNIFGNDPLGIGLDPAIAKQLLSYPAPNNYSNGNGLDTGTYVWNSPYQIRGPHYMGRIDYAIDDNNSIFGRYLYGQQSSLNADPLNGYPQVLPGQPSEGESFRPSHNFALSYRHVFSQTTVNEATVGFSRFTFLFTQGAANPAYPNVPAYKFNDVSTPFSNLAPTQRALTTPQFMDNLTVVHGAHILKMGVNIRLYQQNDLRGTVGSSGNLTPTISLSASVRPPTGFNTPSVSTATAPGISSTDNASLLGAINDLLGIPATETQRFLGNLNSNTFQPYLSNGQVNLYDEGTRAKQYDSYMQDEWKPRSNLTVNLGLRWEANPPPTEAGGRVYGPSQPINGSQGPVTFVHANSWFRRSNLDQFAPRLGIAWSPGKSQKTVVRAGYGISYDVIATLVTTSVSDSIPGLSTSCAVTVGVAAATGCSSLPNLRIGQGFPQQLSAPTLQPSSFLTPPEQLLSNAPGIAVYNPNLKLPTIHEWNLTIQHEFRDNFIVSAGYVGRRGTRLFRNYDINQINSDPILPSFLDMQQNVGRGCKADGSGCPTGVAGTPIPIVTQGLVTSTFVNNAATATDLAQNAAGAFAGQIENTTLNAHLRPNQQFGAIDYIDSGADSYYHSLQAVIQKRFSRGLLLGATYTLAKSIDDISGDPAGAGGTVSTTSTASIVDNRNWRIFRARSDFDRRHVVTANAVYEIPVGRGKTYLGNASRAIDLAIGGWSLNTIATFETGEPFSVLSGALTANNSHQSFAVVSSPSLLQPSIQNQAGIIGPVLFTSASGFSLPAPGNNGSGRNIFQGPNFWDVDLSVAKGFNLTERFHLTFRAEAFNVMNHINFTTGNLSILSPNFGQSLAEVGSASSRNIIQTGEAGRVVQLALKLAF